MKQHDILIVGDGIVGLALAQALTQADNEVAILSKNPLFSTKKAKKNNQYDARVSAITLQSEKIFKDIGVWQAIEERRISPFRDMVVWDATGEGKVRFDSAWLGESHLGHIIENSVIMAALEEKLASNPKLTCYSSRELTELRMTADGIILKAGEESFFVKLVIAADGAMSWVRQQAGFTIKEESYNQTAIVATVETTEHHQETAWQRFLPTGPVAFLPLNHANHSSVVWSCDPVLAEQVMKYDDEAFCHALGEAIDFKLGSIIHASERHSFPLVMRHAERYIMPHIALVGDAAHTIHPLAGQGLNMGLKDVTVLTEVIKKNRQLNRPFPYLPILRQYEREQRAANEIMIKTMKGFKQVFGNEQPLLMRARNTGLNLVENLPWIKVFFMRLINGDI